MVLLTERLIAAPRLSADPLAADRTFVIRRLQESELFREYRQAFEVTTGLPLVLREAGSFRPPLEGSRLVNPFCAQMTQAGPTCAACLRLQARVETEAVAGPKTIVCQAGLAESAVPVRVGTVVLGYLQTGQVFLRSPTQAGFAGVLKEIPGGVTKAGARAWTEAYFQTRVIARKNYGMIIRLLAVFAEHLSAVSNQLMVGRTPADSPLLTKIRAFIAAHQSEPLSLHDAARSVNISPFYFCKLFKAATGLTFTVYLARVRVETAKAMLLDANRRVSEVAFAAGFQSLSQFNRVFRRITGEAPTRHRDRQQARLGPKRAGSGLPEDFCLRANEARMVAQCG